MSGTGTLPLLKHEASDTQVVSQAHCRELYRRTMIGILVNIPVPIALRAAFESHGESEWPQNGYSGALWVAVQAVPRRKVAWEAVPVGQWQVRL